MSVQDTEKKALKAIQDANMYSSYGMPTATLSPDKVLDKWQELMSRKVDEQRMRLKGYEIRYDENRKPAWTKVMKDPIFPEELIEAICVTMSNYLDPVVAFSNMSDEIINNKTLEAGRSLVELVSRYFEKNGIEDEILLKKTENILNSIVNIIHGSLSWAKDGGWMKVFKATEQTIKRVDTSPEKKGFLSGLLP
jgi:hypothetical protein